MNNVSQKIEKIELTPIYVPFTEQVRQIMSGGEGGLGMAIGSEESWLGVDAATCKIYSDDGHIEIGEVIAWLPETGVSVYQIIDTIEKFLCSYLIGKSPFVGLVGFTMGATWSLMYPTFSDVIDEIVVKAGKRSEGIYYGFRTFIGRFSIVVQAATFGIIHGITNFDPILDSQLGPAILGIRIHTALVPALFYFLGFLAMWRIYDLKPKKVQEIKLKLVELDI